MIDVATELTRILDLATELNHAPGVDRRGGHEAWYEARDHIARSLPRSVGLLRKALGIDAEPTLSFCSRHVDLGLDAVRQGGRTIPIERRAARWTSLFASSLEGEKRDTPSVR